MLAAASSVVQEKAELEEIQSDREEVLAKLLASRVLAHGHTTDEMHEQGDLQDRLSLTALGRLGSLDKRLSSLISRLDGEIRQVDEKIGQGFNLIDQDRDGIVTIEELQTVLSLLRDRPKDDAVVQHIVGRLDPDGDGKVRRVVVFLCISPGCFCFVCSAFSLCWTVPLVALDVFIFVCR